MNRSGKKLAEIFKRLDTRLKSADEKRQSEVKGQVGDAAPKKKQKEDEDRHPDNQITSTTLFSCIIMIIDQMTKYGISESLIQAQ